jgi:hypothetical protein
MIEDIMIEEEVYSNLDITIREMMTPMIKLKFKPLDNPGKLLTILPGIPVIKQEGIIGNNVTIGPLQYALWRGCITGAILFCLLRRNM